VPLSGAARFLKYWRLAGLQRPRVAWSRQAVRLNDCISGAPGFMRAYPPPEAKRPRAAGQVGGLLKRHRHKAVQRFEDPTRTHSE
jgi:hypothetical protein